MHENVFCILWDMRIMCILYMWTEKQIYILNDYIFISGSQKTNELTWISWSIVENGKDSKKSLIFSNFDIIMLFILFMNIDEKNNNTELRRKV